MSTGQPATSGAARKARERKARGQAKHVQWLASSYQALAAHHTGGTSVASLLAEVLKLKEALEFLRAEVASLRSTAGRSTDSEVEKLQVPVQANSQDPVAVVRQRAHGTDAKEPSQSVATGVFVEGERVLAAVDFEAHGEVVVAAGTFGTAKTQQSKARYHLCQVRLQRDSHVDATRDGHACTGR